MNETKLLQTPLHGFHQSLGARMVAFAGYSMPVQYSSGIIAEHLHTRKHASLFDVSHMGQFVLRGEGVAAWLESLVPADFEALAAGRQRYGLFTNTDGGIEDDLMVCRRKSDWLMVVNAACKDTDFQRLHDQLRPGINLHRRDDLALLALQGPKAGQVLAQYAPESQAMRFMDCRPLTIAGHPCFVSRSGYSGEDGFEISITNDAAPELAQTLIGANEVEPAGLGARDSLRLEAGLCLYGSDIDQHTTPIEAGLGWSIQKSRRLDGERAGGFPGSEKILREYEHLPEQKRVGLQVQGKVPLRAGAELLDEHDRPVGRITSGGHSPILAMPIAMAYLNRQYASNGSLVKTQQRGRAGVAEVVTLPFITPGYRR